MRNPARTARTAAALMIGLGLVVFVSVFAQGLKDGFRSAVTGSLESNVVMQSSTFLPMPPGAAKVAKDDPEIALVSSIVSDDARLDGSGTHTIEQIDPRTFDRVWKLKWKQGSDATYREMNARNVLVADDLARDHKLRIGSSFSLETRSGEKATYVMRGTYDANNSPLTGFLMAPSAFQKISSNRDPINVFAQTTPGSDPEAVVARIQQRLEKTYPIVEIKTSDQFVKAQLDSINPIIYLLYALLAMSVIISLFGIVNSLVLSIFERTREIGMLRAIGLSRRQTRRMVRYESVITSVIGGILGTVVGLFFGWVMAKGLENQGIEFSVPVGQLIIFLVVAALAGVVSAILPARRASRVKILEALSYE
jgi:putative ABC transport system permease protein